MAYIVQVQAITVHEYAKQEVEIENEILSWYVAVSG